MSTEIKMSVEFSLDLKKKKKEKKGPIRPKIKKSKRFQDTPKKRAVEDTIQ